MKNFIILALAALANFPEKLYALVTSDGQVFVNNPGTAFMHAKRAGGRTPLQVLQVTKDGQYRHVKPGQIEGEAVRAKQLEDAGLPVPEVEWEGKEDVQEEVDDMVALAAKKAIDNAEADAKAAQEAADAEAAAKAEADAKAAQEAADAEAAAKAEADAKAAQEAADAEAAAKAEADAKAAQEAADAEAAAKAEADAKAAQEAADAEAAAKAEAAQGIDVTNKTAAEMIDLINSAMNAETVDALINGETRKTVLKAAEDRKLALQQ